MTAASSPAEPPESTLAAVHMVEVDVTAGGIVHTCVVCGYCGNTAPPMPCPGDPATAARIAHLEAALAAAEADPLPVAHAVQGYLREFYGTSDVPGVLNLAAVIEAALTPPQPAP